MEHNIDYTQPEPTKQFDAERWAEGHNKLNYKTKFIVEKVLNEMSILKEKDILDTTLWAGLRLTIRVETKHIADFHKLSRKVFSRIRWFFPKEGIKLERIDETTIHLTLKNPYNFNATLATWKLNP